MKGAVATRAKPDHALSVRELRSISRALSDPHRFQILKLVAAQACTACADLRTVSRSPLFFASDDAGWVTGQSLLLAGGQTQ